MEIPQARTTRASSWMKVAKRATLSVGLLVAAIAVLVVSPGGSGSIAAALLISGAFAAWMTALMVDEINSHRRPRTQKRTAPRRRIRRKRVSVIAAGQRDDPRIQPGDYFASADGLYRVEHLAGARVLVEDCRSGDLLDIDREACAAFERVKRAAI